MKKIILFVSIVSLFISLFPLHLKAVDVVEVYWIIQDCSTSQPLDSAFVYIIIWDPGSGKGRYSTAECTTRTSGYISHEFPAYHIQRKGLYYIRKSGYIQANGEFIVNTGLNIDVCLWPIGSEPSGEIKQPPRIITGIVKNNEGNPLMGATVKAIAGEGRDSLAQEFSNSRGEFKWSFHPSLLNKSIYWQISKDGYLDAKGDFLIEGDKSLYVTLAPLLPPPKEKTRRSLKRDILAGVSLVGMYVGMLVLTGSI